MGNDDDVNSLSVVMGNSTWIQNYINKELTKIFFFISKGTKKHT